MKLILSTKACNQIISHVFSTLDYLSEWMCLWPAASSTWSDYLLTKQFVFKLLSSAPEEIKTDCMFLATDLGISRLTGFSVHARTSKLVVDHTMKIYQENNRNNSC